MQVTTQQRHDIILTEITGAKSKINISLTFLTMTKFYHLIPPPAPRTPTMIRHDRVKQNAQEPILSIMVPLYMGFIACFLAVSLLLMK
jgi:hypothetical protein